MDCDGVLAAFNEQIRQHSGQPGPDELVERNDDGVVRAMSLGAGWAGVTWSDLDESTADAAIAAQIDRFAQLSRPWEWKHYSYDQPSDLPDRLVAAGFTPESPEALLIAQLDEVPLDSPPPPGVTLRAVASRNDAEALVAVHNEVFNRDHSFIVGALAKGLDRQPPDVAAVVAWVGATPVAAGRVEFHHGTEFASLWGGGTLASWRGRGVFRAVVAHRAAAAVARGFRYLQVDASPDSRPILRRLGFVELAITTPFLHPGDSA